MDRISPKEAQALFAAGWTYVDVRTEQEYEQGHPTGSLNVPLMVAAGSGKAHNPDFLPALEALFEKDAKLVLGCAGGVRSARAAQLLEGAGFTQVKENRAGYAGARDASGAVTEAGWADAGLPNETGNSPDRSWAALVKRLST